MSTLLEQVRDLEDSDPRDPPSLRIRRSRVIAVALVAAAVAAAAAWLLSWWSPVPVREVLVVGASPDTAAEIDSLAGIAVGTAIRDLDPAAVAERVGAVQGIDRVDLQLQRPWTVVIAVEERFPFAAVAADQGWSILDSSGQPVRDVPQQPRRLPVVSGGPENWQSVFAALGALDEATRSRVATASADASGAVELTLLQSRRSPAATIDWGRSERNEEKARVLAALLPLRASAYTVAVPERPAVSEDAVLPKERKAGRTPTSAPSTEPTPDLE